MAAINFIKRTTIRAGAVARLVREPRLVTPSRFRIPPETYRRFNQPWFKAAGIRTVLDIGANTGQFAQLIHAILPEAKLYCFEPLPDCYATLLRRTSNIKRLEAFNVGLGGSEHAMEIHRNSFTPSSSFLAMGDLHRFHFPHTAGPEQMTTVPVKPLDSFRDVLRVEPKLLVKIDVQGFEDEVIRGGTKVIASADLVIMEVSFVPLYDGAKHFDEIHETMKGLGFRFGGCIEQLLGPRDGRILQGDALFEKNSPGSPRLPSVMCSDGQGRD